MQAAYAFFDLDGTLIREASLLSFLRFRLEREDPANARERWHELQHTAAALRASKVSRAEQNAIYYRTYYRGVQVDWLAQLADSWLTQHAANASFWHEEVVARLASHRREGITPVIVTGSLREIGAAIAARLEVPHVLCAPLEEQAGYYTGELTASPTIGAGKVLAVQQFLGREPHCLASCFGYADDESDIGVLSQVGHPRVVAASTPALLEHARRHGWPVLGGKPRAARQLAEVRP